VKANTVVGVDLNVAVVRPPTARAAFITSYGGLLLHKNDIAMPFE